MYFSGNHRPFPVSRKSYCRRAQATQPATEILLLSPDAPCNTAQHTLLASGCSGHEAQPDTTHPALAWHCLCHEERSFTFAVSEATCAPTLESTYIRADRRALAQVRQDQEGCRPLCWAAGPRSPSRDTRAPGPLHSSRRAAWRHPALAREMRGWRLWDGSSLGSAISVASSEQVLEGEGVSSPPGEPGLVHRGASPSR